MKKLLLLSLVLLACDAYAQVPARSIPTTCMRDDTLSTLSQAEGAQVPCRVDSLGNIWVNLGTTLDKTNDSITIWGSDDGGTTKRVIKTDIGGAIQVDCESGCSGGTQYDQGTATTATDKLTMAGAVRRDTAAVDAGVADGDRVVLSTDSVGALRVTLPDNEPLDVAQINGVVPLMGNGVTGTGSLRVTIASDNTPFSVNTNVATMNGVAVTMGNGASGTGVQRVTIASDSTGQVAISGTAAANVTQVGGTSILTGAGNTGAGSPRVTIASDNAPLTVRGANSNAKINCTNNKWLNMTTATTTEIVPLSGATIIYVCSYSIVSNGGTATNVKFREGTGTDCATGTPADVSGNIPLTAATNTVGISRGSGEGMLLKTITAGRALCVTSSGAATLAVDITYAQF